MKTVEDIEAGAKRFAACDHEVKAIAGMINDEMDRVYQHNLPKLKRALEQFAGINLDLEAMIKESPSLFVRPRTMVLHGVKVGFRKGNGGITYDDDEQVIKLIKRRYTRHQADALIHTKESLDKKALAKLPADELKRLGVEVESCGDVVVVSITESPVSKAIAALLKIAEGDE